MEPVRRFETPPGHQGQVDFADFRLPWGKRHALIVVLGYSRRMWLRFYERQTMPVVMIQERLDANDVPVGVHEFSSSLTGLYRLSSGATALFHHDAMLEGEPGRGTITADIYLTVIAPDRKPACVEGPVPHFKAMRAIHTVVRDTVFLLDRRLDEAEEGLESWVRMYRIDTSGCTWLDMD